MRPNSPTLILTCLLSLSACVNHEQSQISAQTDVPAIADVRVAPVATVNTPAAISVPPAEYEIKTKRDRMSAQGALMKDERANYAPPMKMMGAGRATSIYPVVPAPSYVQQQDRERYGVIAENPIKLVAEAPVSTFSIDVDTGSYANVRRMLNAGRLPPADAVRVEELVNYFPYDYALPKGDAPFAVHTEIAPAPWNAQHALLRIGIKGQDVAKTNLPPSNLVFLVDVSGSMGSADKLPLLKSALALLVRQLRVQDHVSLVTYASGTRVVLEPTSGAHQARILAALDQLTSGGATAGAAGITLAYDMAQQGYIQGGINRILLATDGDFNVGITSFDALKDMAAEKRKGGVSLSTLGFGTGNYNEQLMEQLADAGNGNYSYIDTLNEGQKVLVNEMTSTLATIAKDVKIQVEFNPDAVSEYRLIGYENRMLKREDFNNDKVDAGEVGAGHTVTALYELTLKGQSGSVDALRYGKSPARSADNNGELAYLRLRYKAPDGDVSKLAQWPLYERDIKTSLAQTSTEFRFAAAVAAFAQQLRGGTHNGAMDYAAIAKLAADARGTDRYGYRGEFLRLVDLAQSLSSHAPVVRDSGSAAQ